MNFTVEQLEAARQLRIPNTVTRSYRLALQYGLLRKDEFSNLRATGHHPYQQPIISTEPL